MLTRVYHNYEDLEEYHSGMWAIVRGQERMSNALKAAALMRETTRFKHFMKMATHEWPKSCQHNLTAENSNRLAWLGHAGCLLGVGSPEENTRIGWHMLSQFEMDAANKAAQEVLDEWVSSQTHMQGEMFC